MHSLGDAESAQILDYLALQFGLLVDNDDN